MLGLTAALRLSRSARSRLHACLFVGNSAQTRAFRTNIAIVRCAGTVPPALQTADTGVETLAEE